MLKKAIALLVLVLAAAFIVTSVAHAANTKYTFNDVVINDAAVEIEAGVKSVKKGDFSNCNYYSDDYATYLGSYQDDVFAGDTAEDVETFCVTHFDERSS